MATKSLILRPIGDYSYDPSTDSDFSTYPEQTYASDALNVIYFLINDETPDDDTTYIQFNKAYGIPAGLSHYFLFDFSQVEKIREKIITVNFCYRGKGVSIPNNNIMCFAPVTMSTCTDSGSLGDYIFNNGSGLTPVDDKWTGTISETFTTTNLNTYINQNLSIPAVADYLKNLDNAFYNKLYFGTLALITEGQISGSKNSYALRLTQFYLEITYEEDEEIETPIDQIYLKENDVWNQISYNKIYKKENNDWVETDINVFTENQKIVINKLT